MKTSFVVFLFGAILFSSSFIENAAMATSSYCDQKCTARCWKAGLKKRCLKYCGICCGLCKCVPSGTYGNKSECPCYRDMLNSKGKPKCP
ncbi:Snakin-1 [Capsicum chinense]|uniref:Snakin-1 n=1 Tax=Capsicum annuum TaxID=4072 RepID=A0A1U8FEU5_CAPAN|nr:Snakin-1 [Capsicum annuum]KAF3684383.1 Snakin-1 [Capsicum annuum]PHT95954.1 Snakin-1 [Capsicum annuum]PHU08642.1 Snakin-1 [Capsicum chinense]